MPENQIIVPTNRPSASENRQETLELGVMGYGLWVMSYE